MLSFLARRRRERLRSAPFPDAWRAIIARHVPYVRRLTPNERAELEGHVQVLLAEKSFEGCGGLQLQDVHRVTIAAHAALLLLGRETDYYPDLKSILVYPDEYVVDEPHELEGGIVVEGPESYAGHTQRHLSALVLSWRDVLEGIRDPADGVNVVLHEFAHQLDFEDGGDDGTPLHDDASAAREFAKAIRSGLERLREDVRRGGDTLLDPYGAEDPVEFFAVATEAFFELPRELRSEHPDLYRALATYFNQDPAAAEDRLAAADATAMPAAGHHPPREA